MDRRALPEVHADSRRSPWGGYDIVSTASPGIDRAALAGLQRGLGGAITVLTHALEDPDAITPNGFLASIEQNGILVSECPLGRAPGRDSLQSQQRIVATLLTVKPLAVLSELMPQANRLSSPNPSLEAPAGRPLVAPG